MKATILILILIVLVLIITRLERDTGAASQAACVNEEASLTVHSVHYFTAGE